MPDAFLSHLAVPPSDRPVVVRPAGRVIMLDPSGCVLLMRASDGGGSFWFTPGGAIEAGEDVASATIREVGEETDIDLGGLGPVALRRVARMEFLGRWIEAHETFHLVQLDDRPPTRGRNLEPYERDVIRSLDWMSANELRIAGKRLYPRCLPELVEAIAAGALRSPWEEVDVHSTRSRVTVHRS